MKKLALGSVRRLVLLLLVLLLHSVVLLVPVAAHDHAPRGPGAVRLAALSIDSAAVRRGDSGVRVTPAATVVGDGDVLTVLVDNYNRTGHYEDWVGLWSPSRLEDLDNLALHAPVKYQYCTFGNAAYNVTGQAKLSFRMVNMRADYGVYLFSGSVYNPTLLAVADEAVTMADPDAPTKPRLTLHSPTSVRLLWSSTKTEEPFVTYGPEGASRDSWARVVAETNTYTKEDLCGPPANMTGWRDPGPIHSAVLDGLQPGTAYEYAFGDRSHLSIYYTFRAPPADGAPVNVVVLADHGQQTEDQSREPSKPQITPVATTRWIGEKLDADASLSAVMLIGDISYARGYESEWENYLSQIAPVASRVPWVASLGNHEVDWPDTMAAYPHAVDSGGECAVPSVAASGAFALEAAAPRRSSGETSSPPSRLICATRSSALRRQSACTAASTESASGTEEERSGVACPLLPPPVPPPAAAPWAAPAAPAPAPVTMGGRRDDPEAAASPEPLPPLPISQRAQSEWARWPSAGAGQTALARCGTG